jgi:hypothetical protein
MPGAIMPQAALEQDGRAGLTLWLGLLAGPIVYSLHFIVIYLLVETACKADLLRFTWFGLDGIAVWVVALTAIACLATGFSAIIALWNWRRGRPPSGRPSEQRKEETAPLMALAGLWLSVYFTVAILLTGLPAVFLTLCDWI